MAVGIANIEASGSTSTVAPNPKAAAWWDPAIVDSSSPFDDPPQAATSGQSAGLPEGSEELIKSMRNLNPAGIRSLKGVQYNSNEVVDRGFPMCAVERQWSVMERLKERRMGALLTPKKLRTNALFPSRCFDGIAFAGVLQGLAAGSSGPGDRAAAKVDAREINCEVFRVARFWAGVSEPSSHMVSVIGLAVIDCCNARLGPAEAADLF